MQIILSIDPSSYLGGEIVGKGILKDSQKQLISFSKYLSKIESRDTEKTEN